MTLTALMQSSPGVFGAVLTFASLIGAYFAGQKSYSRTLIDAKQKEADGWHHLYDLEKEMNQQLTMRIERLVAEGHQKDRQIAELSGKVSTIENFMRGILSKDALAQLNLQGT